MPIKESLEEPAAKVNALLQAYISGLKLTGFALLSDMVFVTQSAGRIMRAIFEIVLRRGWAAAADRALRFCKMLQHRMWASQTPLRQFKGPNGTGTALPADVLAKIERKDLPWERYYDLSSQELGELIRFPKLGKTLHKLIHQFPRLELACHVQPLTRGLLKVDLTITPDFAWDDAVHGYAEPFWVWVEDGDGEALLHYEAFLLKKQYAQDDHVLSFTVPVQEPLPPQYFVRVVSDRWLGCEVLLPVSFRHLLLPEKFAPPTELLDLQPLPVSALRNPSYEALYAGRLAHFNPIQTQAFTCLYGSDDNALLCAPAGSGKTACAEFALLRALTKAVATSGGASPPPPAALKCVYVAPVEALAEERFADWSAKFGPGSRLGLKVSLLMGETASDLKALERSHVTITTADKWDMLTRRWKQRKAVQAVGLIIFDEMHLLGGAPGPVLEVVASRARYVGSQTGRPARIVALAASLADARDVAEWLGVTSHGLFNFPPAARPIPLEIHVQGIDIGNFEARMAAMARPVYSALAAHASAPSAGGAAPGVRAPGPAIVFVPTRKHARLTALDILNFAASEGAPRRFLGVEEAELEPLLAGFKEPALQHALRYGLGFLHEGMPAAERAALEDLFRRGATRVLVVTAPLCWGLTIAAPLVVAMGTQYFDGANSPGADYPVTDLLQVLRAGILGAGGGGFNGDRWKATVI